MPPDLSISVMALYGQGTVQAMTLSWQRLADAYRAVSWLRMMKGLGDQRQGAISLFESRRSRLQRVTERLPSLVNTCLEIFPGIIARILEFAKLVGG